MHADLLVGRAGLEPAHLLYIRQAPSPAWPPASWPPRNRTARYRLIRTAPSTSWVVASGKWRCRAPAASGRARVFKARSRAGGALSMAERPGVEPGRRCHSAVFGTAAVTSRLASPRRMAGGSNTRRTLALTSGFRPGTLPLGQPSTSGERTTRTPRPRAAQSLAATPSTLAGSLSLVPNLGFEPRTSRT